MESSPPTEIGLLPGKPTKKPTKKPTPYPTFPTWSSVASAKSSKKSSKSSKSSKGSKSSKSSKGSEISDSKDDGSGWGGSDSGGLNKVTGLSDYQIYASGSAASKCVSGIVGAIVYCIQAYAMNALML